MKCHLLGKTQPFQSSTPDSSGGLEWIYTKFDLMPLPFQKTLLTLMGSGEEVVIIFRYVPTLEPTRLHWIVPYLWSFRWPL